MAHAEKQCEKCRWFEWARDMNATNPYCNLKHEYEPEICYQYGTLEDVDKRIKALEQLCRDMHKELKLLVDLGATISGIDTTTHRMDALGLLEGEQ